MNIKELNYRAIIAGLVLIIVGIMTILVDYFCIQSDKNVFISVGCSLLASGIVILVQAYFVDSKPMDYVEEWGLTRIFKTRAEKNVESEKRLSKVKERLDVIAFGLKSFRSMQTKKVEKLLKKGVSPRILTMYPMENNVFLEQREREENEPIGQIKKSIEDLVQWADKLNKKSNKGKIEIKGYKCMTLDFYWRADNDLYIGPYWYGIGSQQTITYKFEKGKQGFDLYAEYFEKLWEDENNTVILTEKK